jgi:hypothetical protein
VSRQFTGVPDEPLHACHWAPRANRPGGGGGWWWWSGAHAQGEGREAGGQDWACGVGACTRACADPSSCTPCHPRCTSTPTPTPTHSPGWPRVRCTRTLREKHAPGRHLLLCSCPVGGGEAVSSGCVPHRHPLAPPCSPPPTLWPATYLCSTSRRGAAASCSGGGSGVGQRVGGCVRTVTLWVVCEEGGGRTHDQVAFAQGVCA